MVNLIISLAIIHYIGYFIFGKSNVLSCGIFGMATNDPQKINSANLKILGLFNETRGRTACGITIDGELYHGEDKEKLFSDFAKGRDFSAHTVPVVIGHTRQASAGTIASSYNIHPFGFGKYKDGYAFVGVHNGTLLNHTELARKYEVETTEMVPSTYTPGTKISRTKIDSELLLEIIYKTQSYKVLSEYNGRAALVWQDLKNPNIVYLYSGKSVANEGEDETKAVEERPMNVWIYGSNTFYFSSIPESLEVIGATAGEVFQIDYNTVYQIKNGDFKHAKKTKISRVGNYHTETYTYTNYNWRNNHNSCNNHHKRGNEKRGEGENKIDLSPLQRVQSLHIFEDKPIEDENSFKGKVYTKQFRYFSNGHTINGIYCYINNYGFYKLGDTFVESQKKVSEIIGKTFSFAIGDFVNNLTTIPFINENLIEYYYFVNGVMLETMLDYSACCGYKKNAQYSFLTAEKMSMMSKHPVANISIRQSQAYQQIYKDGVLFTGNFKGLGYDKTYYVRNGNFYKYTTETGLVVANSLNDLNLTDTFSNKGSEDSCNVIKLPVTTETSKTEGVIRGKDYDPMIFQKTSEYLKDYEDKYQLSLDESKVEDIDDSEFIIEVAIDRFSEVQVILDDFEKELEDWKEHDYVKMITKNIIDIKQVLKGFIK